MGLNHVSKQGGRGGGMDSGNGGQRTGVCLCQWTVTWRSATTSAPDPPASHLWDQSSWASGIIYSSRDTDRSAQLDSMGFEGAKKNLVFLCFLLQKTSRQTRCQQRRHKRWLLSYTDKKEKKIFLIYKEIQKGSVAKSINWQPLHIWLNICAFPHICIRKPFLIYDFAPDPIWVSLYLSKILFSFYQCNSKHCSLENVLIGLYNVHLSLLFQRVPFFAKTKEISRNFALSLKLKNYFRFNPYHTTSFFNCFVMRPGRDDAIGRGWTGHWQIQRPQQVTQPQGPGIHWRLVFSPFISITPRGVTYVIRVWSDLATLMSDAQV
jgi:hypothetical protein